MVKQDRVKFIGAFGALCEIFGKEPTEILIDGYFKSLSGFSIKQVEMAISKAVTTLKFFPKPVELIEIIKGGAADIESQSIIEATKVLETIKRIGGYQSIRFTDPITNAVIKYGFDGWQKLCDRLTVNENKWFIKDFSKIYSAYAKQGIQYSKHLPGITEAKNAELGYDQHIPIPILIGVDQDKEQLPYYNIRVLEYQKE